LFFISFNVNVAKVIKKIESKKKKGKKYE